VSALGSLSQTRKIRESGSPAQPPRSVLARIVPASSVLRPVRLLQFTQEGQPATVWESMRTEHVLQIKVTLRHLKPSVWRRIVIPEHYSFWELHVAIQDSMGWLDTHLHEFVATNPLTGEKDHIGYPDEESLHSILPGWDTPVIWYLNLICRRITYTYDFGDDWEHSIELEQIRPRDPSAPAPACIAGLRRCPPEDSGGPAGYANILAAITNPKHPERSEILEWLGGTFDPNQFDRESVTFDDPSKRFELAFSRD
jgi:Plasmid pRiA4b ORF-3-like protein